MGELGADEKITTPSESSSTTVVHLDADPARPAASLPLRVIAVATVIALLYFGRPVLLPIVLAVFLFYALDPIVDRLESWRLPRALASVAVVLLVVSGVSAGAISLWPQFEAVITRIPEATAKLGTSMRRARSGAPGATAFKKVKDAADALDKAAVENAAPPVTAPGTLRVEVTEPWRVSDLLWSGGMGALGLVGQAMSVLFLTVFLLIEDDTFKRKLVRRMETLGNKRITVKILNDVSRQIERFIWVQAITSAGVAVITGLGLWWLGVEQPAVWGVFAGLMNLVPYFGPVIVTVVVGAVAFLQFGTLGQAGLVAGMTIVITTLEGNFVTPQLLSRVASLNLVAVFVSIAFWSWVWGVAGMLLAMPMLMAFKVMCDHLDGWDAAADFIGSEPATPASATRTASSA